MWKKKSNWVAIISCTVININLCWSQDSLTLAKAIELGLSHNYDIQLAQKKLESAAVNNDFGNAGFFPEVSADGSYSRRLENTELEFVDGNTINREGAVSTNLNAGVSANWYIFDGSKMFLEKTRLEALETKAELELKANINNQLAELINTYHQLVAEEKTLELYRNQENLSQQRLELAINRLKNGADSELNKRQAEVDLNGDQSAVLQQEIRILELKAKLNRLMGRAVETDFFASDSIQLNNKLDYEQLKGRLEQNPNLSAYQQDLEIAVINKKETFAERLPKIGLNGRYSLNESESEAGFLRSNQTDGINYGATISIPIFNGFAKNREAQLNQIQIEESKLNYELSLAQSQEQLLVQYQSYKRKWDLLELEQRNARVAKENLKFALESYRLGGISAIDLREIQLSTLAAQERLLLTKYSIKLSETELLRLSNQLIDAK